MGLGGGGGGGWGGFVEGGEGLGLRVYFQRSTGRDEVLPFVLLGVRPP